MKNAIIFKRLLKYLKEYRLRLCLVLLSAVISTAFMVLAPFLVGKVTTTLFASIEDGVFYWETILWLLAALVALYFISQTFSFLQGFGMAKIKKILLLIKAAGISIISIYESSKHPLSLQVSSKHTTH